MQPRWQFLQVFVYGDVVYAQTWEVLTLKNCIERPYGDTVSYGTALAWTLHLPV